MQAKVKPDYIFEVSWEVCNKVGGIHTVIATKLKSIQPEYGDKYMVIGPELNKDTQGNTEFIEDKNLMADWKDQMASEGVIIRIGRWKIEGAPIAILIDFTALFPNKNEILSKFWERYQLDSLSGQWDYVEPALFGYAAGKVIESYYDYFLNFGSRVAAHFHEWMTGSGILYLESNAPQIARVFTTHATVLGRSIAGNGLNLYDDMEAYNPEVVSTQFNLRSKYSLEKKAAENAHVFTTVSEVTARECEVFIGKKPDIITPNGFDDTLVPKGKSYQSIREKARNKMISVAAALSGKDLNDDIFITITSGRYEYRNKGIDVYLETLKTLKPQIEQGKNVLAFIAIPTAHFGPDVNLVKRLAGKTTEITDARLTHNLIDYDQDPVIEFCNQHGLNNLGGSGLTVVFVPAYLKGDDGIFNMDYYELLMGCDLSIFPSYYEPWGYTPLESLAFAVPTVTTNLAGFGRWVQRESKPVANGITVLERNDENSDEVEAQLVKLILTLSNASAAEREKSSKEAKKISATVQWSNLVQYYYHAYELAFSKISTNSDEINPVIKPILKKTNNLRIQQKPDWKKVLIKPVLPKEIKALVILAKNMWWTWNIDARELFCSIDSELWNEMEQNPISMLEEISSDRLQKLVKDVQFMAAYNSVIAKFNTYMAEPTPNKQDLTAYFSMEFVLMIR